MIKCLVFQAGSVLHSANDDVSAVPGSDDDNVSGTPDREYSADDDRTDDVSGWAFSADDDVSGVPGPDSARVCFQVTHWQHPRFHAYFPAGNSFPSILGDMLSDAIGCVGFSWVSGFAFKTKITL